MSVSEPLLLVRELIILVRQLMIMVRKMITIRIEPVNLVLKILIMEMKLRIFRHEAGHGAVELGFVAHDQGHAGHVHEADVPGHESSHYIYSATYLIMELLIDNIGDNGNEASNHRKELLSRSWS